MGYLVSLLCTPRVRSVSSFILFTSTLSYLAMFARSALTAAVFAFVATSGGEHTPLHPLQTIVADVLFPSQYAPRS